MLSTMLGRRDPLIPSIIFPVTPGTCATPPRTSSSPTLGGASDVERGGGREKGKRGSEVQRLGRVRTRASASQSRKGPCSARYWQMQAATALLEMQGSCARALASASLIFNTCIDRGNDSECVTAAEGQR